jgi:hypothetical protein
MLMLAISAEEAVKDYAVILSLARNWEQLPTRRARGYSSAGRAPGSHPGGRRFESA